MKLLTILLCGLPVAAVLRAETDLQTSAYRNSIAQDEVRRQAEEVGRQLALLLEDIRQNQLDAPEAALALQAAAKLRSLGDEQILPLVRKLREAGALDDSTGLLHRLAEASREQKDILVLLKSMADNLSLHRDQATIPQRLEQLVLRQTTNLRQTRDVAPSGKPAEIASLCQSEQVALRQEVDLLMGTLQRVVDGLPAAENSKFATALAEMKAREVPALASSAAEETTAGKFAAALPVQIRLRDALQFVLLKVKEDLSPRERAEALAARMKELAAQQAALAEATRKAPSSAAREMREAQRQLADRMATLQKEVRDLNADAADRTAQAEEAMKKAAGQLASEKKAEKNAVADAQNRAAEQLGKAGEELAKTAEQLADAKVPQHAGPAMAELTRLSQQIAEAQARQNALAGQPNREQAKNLAKKVADLQRQALPLNAEAAQNLGEAAGRMRQNNPQEAAQALAEANAAVQAQMQAVAQAAARDQQMQAVSREIAQARATAEEARRELQNTRPGQDHMAAIRKTEEAQKYLQAAERAALAAGAPADVRQALQQARQELGRSKLDAAQMKRDAALAANAEAQKNLQAAMQSAQQASAAALAAAMPSARPRQNMAQQAGKNGPTIDGQAGSGMDGRKGDDANRFPGAAGPQGTVAQVAGALRPRDREAIAALQKEKAPTEYQGMASQYLKNLAAGEYPANPLP